ncbi:MAG: hypothetical protein H6819_04940 [Phycisphaerales bacterium]|nr:hypothetical protein [Phycisphaerales bacterium]MCB9854874.1 hypothetical protein [Phycisphaerales bacterium]MCB9865004.1 hypothetical protein [Phycisphaerales bacterium]
MAFLNGSVSYARFRVHGGGPKRLDEHLLDKIREHRIGSDKILRSDLEESGWIGGRHLLDVEFDLEKNVLLDCLHFGLRIDAHKPPPDLLRAYEQQEFDALLKEASGHGTPKFSRIKKEAREAAKGRIESELKEGRYRKQRQFPLFLDTQRDILYVSATTPSVHERLLPLFKNTFGKRLEPLTAGSLAIAWADHHNQSRQLENLEYAAFIPHPENGLDSPYWTSHDPAARDWLGNEFLLWLWYTLEEESDTLEMEDNSDAAVMIVKQLALECPWAETGKETITCDGPSRLPESRRAIQSGKLPRKAGMMLSRHGQQYEFTMQAETFNISGAALPKVERDEDAPTNGDGAVDNIRVRHEERLEQIRHMAESVDMLFGAFLTRRLRADWNKTRDTIRAWLRAGAGDQRNLPETTPVREPIGV